MPLAVNGTSVRRCVVNQLRDKGTGVRRCMTKLVSIMLNFHLDKTRFGSLTWRDASLSYVDIDECKQTEKYSCFGRCTNTNGSFSCKCARGFKGNATLPNGCVKSINTGQNHFLVSSFHQHYSVYDPS
jgi:hypothetical protein